MGAYHFKLDLVPPGAIPSPDGENYLLSFPIPDSIVQRLRTVFSKTGHWGGVEEYRSDKERGSDLRIYHADDGRIAEIEFRFAPVADSIETLREFLTITKDSGCHILVVSAGTLIAPDFDEVFRILRTHHSFHLLSDPEGAIFEAAKKVNESS